MASKTLTQASIFLGPATALFMAGYSFAASQNTVNHVLALKTHPKTSVPLFKRIFYSGGKVGIPLSALSGLMSLYVAWQCKSWSQRRLFIWAGLSSLVTGPWTMWVMGPGIRRLIEMEGDKRVMEKSVQTLEHEQLLRGWVRGNWVRFGCYVVSGGLGLWGVVFG